MTHRIRVFLSMAILLAVVVLGAWTVLFTSVLKPVVDRWTTERVELAVGAAELVEGTPQDEQAALKKAATRLGVKVQILDALPKQVGRATVIEKDGHTVYLSPRTGNVTVVTLDGGRRFLGIRFADEIAHLGRRAALGLVLVAALGTLGALVATRWVLRPLEAAEAAMHRVSEGDLRHRVAEGSDVTGRIGRTFNQMAGRVEGMVDGQKELLAAVSHELRTPLTRTRLVLEMMKDEGVSATRIASLENDVDELDRLVDTLLESTRLDRGGWTLEKRDAGLASLVRAAAEGLELGGRSLSVEIPEDLIAAVDSLRLTRVFRNLFTNFVRYTPPTATCTVRARVVGNAVEMTVEDDGPGVPAEALHKLFRPFFRVDASRSRATGGHGLGLLLVRQVVEAHGGTVVAEAREGGGLRFRILMESTVDSR